MYVIPDDFADFPSTITPATGAVDAEGQPISGPDLSGLVYVPKSSDDTVIARTIPDPANPMQVNNHVGNPGIARVWVDVTLGDGGRVVGSTTPKIFTVTTGAIASLTGMGDDFSQSGLPAEGPDPTP